MCFQGDTFSGGGPPMPVGNVSPAGDGRWGHSDMDGSVWEWLLDWYAPYSEGAVTNPAGPATGEHRSVRSGFFYVDYATGQRAANRHERDTVPELHDVSLALRCARDVP